MGSEDDQIPSQSTPADHVSSVPVGHSLLNRMPSVSLLCSKKSKLTESGSGAVRPQRCSESPTATPLSAAPFPHYHSTPRLPPPPPVMHPSPPPPPTAITPGVLVTQVLAKMEADYKEITDGIAKAQEKGGQREDFVGCIFKKCLKAWEIQLQKRPQAEKMTAQGRHAWAFFKYPSSSLPSGLFNEGTPPPPPVPTGVWPRGASKSKHTSAPANTKMGHILTLRPELSPKGDKAQNPVDAAQLLPHSGRREGTRTAKHCLRDTHNQGTELAMKVVRQAQLELSGGSTPDLLRPPGPPQGPYGIGGPALFSLSGPQPLPTPPPPALWCGAHQQHEDGRRARAERTCRAGAACSGLAASVAPLRTRARPKDTDTWGLRAPNETADPPPPVRWAANPLCA